MQAENSLSDKYNIPVPRYTSYPTVPSWKEGIDITSWKEGFSRQFIAGNASDGISLYVHLPFCESLCIYCGCTKRITTNHSVEETYIQAVLAEWEIYRSLMAGPPVIRELHLGGGTPTFFSPGNLSRLIEGILKGAVLHAQHSFSLEGHPNNTCREHLDVLYALGFRRISYGVQDTNEEVQRLIHRIQPFENVQRATGDAREAGFTSVNFDLIYGLPGQSPDRLHRTIAQSLTLRPDRVAFYSYAHVPQVSCNQRLIDEKLLPSAPEKLSLYNKGRAIFMGHGYTDIGMDHFSLPTDELYHAWKAGDLHRNFMGYTVQKSSLLLGLGLSAISDTGDAYGQNSKSLTDYYRAISAGVPAIRKGYFLQEEDKVFRRHILDIACMGQTTLLPAWSSLLEEWTIPQLRALERDGLVSLHENEVKLTETGRPFLRHVCKAFDLHLLRSERARGNATGVCRPAFAASI
ncbi:oxygen-independent coproporphyrinogen III oxidase [Flavitalea sp. BT771]|uniref:oxygen-independent coproporphyrinogen III oxidase n=1 Tax=Flavitalea sp. BT771 TaxID=3063329 RepID=UPI0026E355E8|nr:oxygen-independent coproporphyrinogen III oxidase [Flavitalea sp. BT771]MDO6429509.1 oxygen-independent coproporphyrinogen III oxidase [Flavitalea sp. BT771]MDV6218363.1 oxygen-independent coproporphyrinogen III oxidase [Flavitalea sp. BT771]